MTTKVRKEFDLEAAKAVLGHSATNVTSIYAEMDRQRAVEVASYSRHWIALWRSMSW